MMFPKDIANIIAGYAVMKRLVSWVKTNEIFNRSLVGNPNALDAIDFVDTNDIRDSTFTCRNPNPNLIEYIREHYEAGEKVNLIALATNPNIFAIHQEDIEKIRAAILECEF